MIKTIKHAIVADRRKAQEAFKISSKYFKGDFLAAQVFLDKYALRDTEGNLLEKSPEDMHCRLSREFARIEKKYLNPLNEEGIFSLLDRFRYLIPGGSAMFGIGNDFQTVSLSNCFVVGLEGACDSYGGILKIEEEQVQIMKRRGGVGHDLSHIRPKRSPVHNSALTSTGLVPFMNRYSSSTREVAQGGRRGALMLTVSVEHPDIEDFIDAKLEDGKVTGANISVRLTDRFMKAVLQDKPFLLQYPTGSENPVFTQTVSAKELWKKIVHNAWQSAEPGVLFWDTILRESIPDCYASLGFGTQSTNPCAELPLCSYDSCRLLSINLYSYVNDPFTDKAIFDFGLLAEHTRIAQRLMDDLIDLEEEKINQILLKIQSDPEEESVKATERRLWEKIKYKTLKGRRTGLGITAEGDMLAALGLRYGSPEAIDLAEQVHRLLAISAYQSSIFLAEERGSFEIFDVQREKNNPFMQRLMAIDPSLGKPRRNIACLTIAPTGSVSLLTRTTSGIEPLFSPVYTRRRKVEQGTYTDRTGDKWEDYTVFHEPFTRWMQIQNKTYSDELLSQSPWYRATAQDVDWVSKVRMQGKIQKWIDHSISCTINLPKETDKELISQLYIEAWKSGCKGVTVYRDGSRKGILSTDTTSPKRPRELEAHVVRFQNSKERWIAFVGLINGRPYEIFTGLEGSEPAKDVIKGKISKTVDEKGGKRYDFCYLDRDGTKNVLKGLSTCFNPEYWNCAKLISGLLRCGMPIRKVIRTVQGLNMNDSIINTWKNGVVRVLKQYAGEELEAQTCPQCGQKTLVCQEGCVVCSSCGHSECG